jgi:putative endonuclease
MSQDPRHAFGESGENIACRELRRRGYEIIARRYRTRAGEIDIVARDGDTLVFVEVKTRHSHEFGTPAEAITRAKQRKLGLMAADYLARHSWDAMPCRFDVVGITVGVGKPEIEVIPDAFVIGW